MDTSRANSVWWLRLIAAVAAMSAWWQMADSQPQGNLLNIGCSQYNASNIPSFYNSLNVTFTDLRRQLSGGRTFATAEQARSSDPVYAMVQCRNYLSERDCLACYNTAASQIRNCSAGNGARVIYDDCFLSFVSTPTSKRVLNGRGWVLLLGKCINLPFFIVRVAQSSAKPTPRFSPPLPNAAARSSATVPTAQPEWCNSPGPRSVQPA
ncbi:cysteine-rich repeat secretory protein 55 [Phtheirospermum japonicum]|uniref:Cysteine-rich repeat secretory protein 55 n=1 Tax=Phtheirospermum japonicum TaxID=374723 RepID=A0A830BCV2_9LAMI|nr:cysteine-rich repeat secretory protein 55 [Phtheirospermum japonicum]